MIEKTRSFHEPADEAVQRATIARAQGIQQLSLVAERERSDACVYSSTGRGEAQHRASAVPFVVRAHETARGEQALHGPADGDLVHRGPLRDFDCRQIRVASK